MNPSRRIGASLAAIVTIAGCSPGPESQPEPGVLLQAGEPLVPWHASVLRARTTQISEDVTAGARPLADGLVAPAELQLDLFDDTSYRARLEEVRRGRGGLTWVGHVDGAIDSQVMLSVVDGVYAGTVRAFGELYQIGYLGNGLHSIVEQDEAAIPGEAPPSTPDVVGAAEGGEANEPPASGDGATTVDVLVVYTAAAGQAAGGDAGMVSLIELAEQETNQGYAASGVGISLRVVHTAQTSYDEVGFDWEETLSRLQSTNDGFMDEVHALRDQVGADDVVLIVETVGPYAGLGYQLLQPVVSMFEAYAFSVVARSYATGVYTFGHELGHNMGAAHDHNHADEGFYADSFGLQEPTAGFRTIMAYWCDGCPRTNHWSNPDVLVNGAPTGVAGWANNARALNHTADILSSFRPTVVLPPSDVAEMVWPEQGTMLPSGMAVFAWTNVGAQAYQLTIGDSPGDATHYDGPKSSATFAKVFGLPEDGSTLHARLWSFISPDDWQYRDYSYTAHSPPSYAADVHYPAAGSTLTATAVPFFWWDSGANGYRLQVGTEADPDRYFDAELGQAQWAYVAGLPTDGSELVGRLWAYGPAGTAVTTTTYTAYAAPPYAAHLVYPLPGTTLAGSVDDFAWSTGAAPLEHQLVVRHGDGTPFFSTGGSDSPVAVTGLPTDGSVVVATLYTLGPSGWAETSAVYQAASE